MVVSGRGLYTGETSRSLGERAGEHMEAARELDRGSHMVKHWFLDHPGEGSLPNFQFRVIGKYKDCLTRQIKEAIRVQNRPNNLNSKGEWGGGTIPRLVVEKAEWERKKEEVEKTKLKEEEDRKWEAFMVGRGALPRVASTSQESLKLEWSHANHTSTEAENKTATWITTTPCLGGAVQENVASTHFTETIHTNIAAGAAQQNIMTDVPHTNVQVRGGRRGKGTAFMTVSDISVTFKKISAKNKILEHLSGKNGPGGSPKRKFESENSDMESPRKRNKFNSTFNFWLELEGNKTNSNFGNNKLEAGSILEPGSEKNLRGQCEGGIICEQLED